MSQDIYKYSQDKHLKYYDFYDDLANKESTKNIKTKEKEYWGLGIENESYLMFENFIEVDLSFLKNNQKRERYSVNYWVNFKKEELDNALEKLPPKINIPVYINSYLFQKADIFGEHTKKYSKLSEPNPKFCGETVEEYLKKNSIIYNKLFDKNMIYDGDTFEFTTFNFYKSNVKTVIAELTNVKKIFLDEINKKLVNINDKSIFKNRIIYPKFNYGFAKFQTNLNNIAICNNGTYHINITLPTELNKDGNISKEDIFKNIHCNAIRAIQWFEPFLIGLYGSPDILHMLSKNYAGGSLRLMLSRYIGLGTYNESKMIKGKMLNDFNYKGHYFEKLHENSPYIPPETIGYDINYNKFLKHGIELRIFDYFPEEYLEDILNFIILICQYSIYTTIPDPKLDNDWVEFVIDVLKNGSITMVPPKLSDRINNIFETLSPVMFPFLRHKKPRTILHFMNKIANKLHYSYKDFSICKKMSPNMRDIQFVDYNSKIKEEFKSTLGLL